jgi:Uma2 family endonuclease
MEAEVTKRLFTVDEYHRMAEAGILHDCDPVELIDGEILQLSPIGDRHAVCVSRATTLFIRAFGENAVVSPGNPVRLTDWTEPQPDIVVFKPRRDFYAKKRPTTRDLLFIVEVSDTTLSYDRSIKLPRYAEAGIPEVWIEDLKNDVLHLYRNPAGRNYKAVRMLRPNDVVSPFAFPEVTFRVDELLSTDYEE